LPHLWPTGSSLGSPPSTTARYFSAYPSDPASRRTPCPPKHPEWRLQVRLGCVRLSPACPFRRLHTYLSLRPARHYPRFWIRRPSSERRRDLNPPDLGAAQRTLRASPPLCPASVLRPSRLLTAWVSPFASGRQVPVFLTEACLEVTPPSCRTPVGPSAAIVQPLLAGYASDPGFDVG
jgi:hypothetical protein